MGEILLKLCVENVEMVFKDCLLPNNFKNDAKVIPVHTVTGTYGFDPVKLDKHSNDIKEMISQLSSNFDECNQGYTFIDLPFKGDGNCKQVWGEQRTSWGLTYGFGSCFWLDENAFGRSKDLRNSTRRCSIRISYRKTIGHE